MPKFLSSFLLPFSFLDFFWSFLSQFRITRSLSLFQSPPRTTKYEYTPLDANTTDIRLVELLPGVQDDPIRISIVTKPLVIQDALIASEIRYLAFENLEGRIGFWNPQEETTSWRHPDPHYSNARHELDEPAPIVAQPSFEALSYTWGSNEDHADIEVVHVAQSLSLDSTMTVQQNLLDALIHLRSPTSTRTLWIDAICLNQEDLVERSQQVKRMGDIYRCAWRVVVWLGLPAFNSSRALQLLGRVGDMVEISRRRQILPAPGCKLETFPIVEASSIDGDEETWIAVDKLLSRPWFKRVWVSLEHSVHADPSNCNITDHPRDQTSKPHSVNPMRRRHHPMAPPPPRHNRLYRYDLSVPSIRNIPPTARRPLQPRLHRAFPGPPNAASPRRSHPPLQRPARQSLRPPWPLPPRTISPHPPPVHRLAPRRLPQCRHRIHRMHG
jgi:hypothetical protein